MSKLLSDSIVKRLLFPLLKRLLNRLDFLRKHRNLSLSLRHICTSTYMETCTRRTRTAQLAGGLGSDPVLVVVCIYIEPIYGRRRLINHSRTKPFSVRLSVEQCCLSDTLSFLNSAPLASIWRQFANRCSLAGFGFCVGRCIAASGWLEWICSSYVKINNIFSVFIIDW